MNIFYFISFSMFILLFSFLLFHFLFTSKSFISFSIYGCFCFLFAFRFVLFFIFTLFYFMFFNSYIQTSLILICYLFLSFVVSRNDFLNFVSSSFSTSSYTNFSIFFQHLPFSIPSLFAHLPSSYIFYSS